MIQDTRPIRIQRNMEKSNNHFQHVPGEQAAFFKTKMKMHWKEA
jgi:hypothetical protein